jgi:GxxExxY protein
VKQRIKSICVKNDLREPLREFVVFKLKIMNENDISFDIRGAAFKVYNELGPGLLESVYETALAYELSKNGYEIERQKEIPVKYDDITFDIGFRLDILVDNKVIIEIKSVETLARVHYKQLMTYLKLSDKKLGLLINFNTSDLKSDIKRIVNNL